MKPIILAILVLFTGIAHTISYTPMCPNWSSTTTYAIGDCVSDEGGNYLAVTSVGTYIRPIYHTPHIWKTCAAGECDDKFLYCSDIYHYKNDTIYDTTTINVTVNDTIINSIIVNDTTINPVTVNDTTIVTVTVNDTTHNPVTVNDTTIMPIVIYDTTVIAITMNDTLINLYTIYDTIHSNYNIIDTIVNNFFISDTLNVIDTIKIPMEFLIPHIRLL